MFNLGGFISKIFEWPGFLYEYISSDLMHTGDLGVNLYLIACVLWDLLSNELNVVTPICKAATVAYFNAKIAGKTPDEAKLAAAGAYVPLLIKDFGADPGEACIKSQEYVNK